MKLSALTLLFACCTTLLFAQKPYSIKGSVADSMATYKLVNTTITLLNQKDSTLVKYSRANAEGAFAINNLRPGKFILLITYPGYADYAEDFVLDSINSVKDFGNLNLILRSTLLEGVIIKGKASAITIKGDTTEFNAGSYNIKPNSKVEDLLRQLPGIQVDKNGKITAQGQTVNKVLVDGEEFFGDDPTLVTKNLRGDMIDKVQLYDKKSDQATFTGIDDGQKSKTINLKLKEDKKNGAFGSVEAGVGTKDFYRAQASANIFKGREKYSAYGSIGNTGDLRGGGFSFDNVEFVEGGAIIMSGMDMEDYGGGGNAQGIPLNKNAGLHYENKWKDKYSLNSNYKLNSTNTKGENTSLSINHLPELNSTTTNNSRTNSESFSRNQKLDGTVNIQIDSSSTLKVMASGALKDNNSTEDYTSSSQREDNSFINTGKRTVSNEGDDKTFNASVFWSKKMKKKGRTVSVNVKQTLNQNEGTGYLNSENEFFRPNKPDSTAIVDQFKTNKTSKSTFVTNATYTEPLSKTFAVVLNYGLNVANSNSDKKSFNKDFAGNYTDLDREFSNHFELDQITNNGGVNFSFRKDKSVLTFGTRLTAVSFKQLDVYENKSLTRDFVNWMPQLNYNYNISRGSSLRVGYNGSTTQPGIEQIQPFRANTNPLYLVIGNPDLKPSFNNSISLSYNSYKMLSEQSLWVNGNFGFTSNAITNNTVTDTSTNATTSQAINLSGKTPVNFNFSLNGSRKVLGLSLGIAATVSGNNRYNMSNNKLNTSQSFNYSFGPSLSKFSDKYNFNISFNPSYNTSSNSIGATKTNNDSWGAMGNFDLGLRLPGKIDLGTNGSYQYTGKSQSFNESITRVIVDVSIGKKFMKDESLSLTVVGKDLLNQNSGFSRSVSDNTFNQNTYITIQRYFMVSLTWDFNRMGGASIKK